MTGRLLVSIAVATLLASQSATGQQAVGKKEELIRELIIVTELKNNAGKIVDSILAELDRQYPQMIEKLLDAEPGLTPAERDRLKSVMKESHERFSQTFRDRLAERVDIGHVVEEIVYSLYDKYFSEEEIGDLITFYRTPTGKKTLSVVPQLLTESMRLAGDRMLPVISGLITEIVAEEKERLKRIK